MSSHRTIHFWQLALKELREILRDRRTIITLVLMPVLVYPLLGVAFQKFLLTQARSKENKIEYIIGFESDSDMLQFNDFLASTRPNTKESSEPKISALLLKKQNKETLEDNLTNYNIDLGIRNTSKSSPPNNSTRLDLVTLGNSLSSKNAKEYIKKRIENFNRDQIDDLFIKLKIPSPPEVVVTESEVHSEQKAQTDVSIATIIPLILILMTVTGAVYPAIDLTAGERERGTMETLIAAPIPRMRIMLAKYVAVLTVAMLTAIMNLLAMWTTVYSIGFENLLFGDAGLELLLVIQILALLLLFAGFFSAVLLGITSVARSFKEAQAYLIPLMLVSLSPGILSLMPGIEMNWYLSLTPLINIVLLARNILEKNVSLIPALLAIVSTVFYGFIALHWAAKVFGSDAILYGSSGTWSDLWHQKKASGNQIPTKQAWFSLALITPLFLLSNGITVLFNDSSMTERLMISAIITFVLFVLIPIITNHLLANPLKETFSLKRTKPVYFLSAFLLGISVWPFAYELTIYFLPVEQLNILKELFDSLNINLKETPLIWVLLTLAVTPAACEEFFFRGYLQNIFSNNGSKIRAILISAFLFAAFHVIVKSTLSLERFFPSFLLGIILGTLYHTSKSVYPGMILHVFHNGLLLTISHYEDFLKKQNWGFDAESQQHLPAMILVIAGCIVLVGLITLLYKKKQS